MLYDLASIEKKSSKLYESGDFFVSFMKEVNLFPFTLSIKKPTQKSVLENLANISNEVKKLQSCAFSLEYKKFEFKSIGSQRLPISLSFQTPEQYLSFIGKTEEFSAFKGAYIKAMKSFEELKELFLLKPKLLVQNIDVLDEILAVCKFLQANPHPNLYVRELSISGVDTKFIQKNRAVIDMFLKSILDTSTYSSEIQKLSENGFEKKYGFKFEEPLVRFRILDEKLYLQGMSDITLPISEFKRLKMACDTVYIVENKITTLSFPKRVNSIVIFGKGYGVGILKDVAWLRSKNIFYWGDIDMDGFAILSQARSYFSQVKSLMMDSKTAETFKELAISSEDKSFKNLSFLNDEENLLYERLYNDFYRENYRLEQEKIPFEYVLQECFPY